MRVQGLGCLIFWGWDGFSLALDDRAYIGFALGLSRAGSPIMMRMMRNRALLCIGVSLLRYRAFV